MKNKIKLTDLNHLEPMNDEMAHLKGGDDPEMGPLCFGCNCTCTCTGNTQSDNLIESTYSSKRHSGVISSYWDSGAGKMVIIYG